MPCKDKLGNGVRRFRAGMGRGQGVGGEMRGLDGR